MKKIETDLISCSANHHSHHLVVDHHQPPLLRGIAMTLFRLGYGFRKK
jgi:hypothetical protein